MSRVDSTLLSLVISEFIVSQYPFTDLPSKEYQKEETTVEPKNLKRNTGLLVFCSTPDKQNLLSVGVREENRKQGIKEEAGGYAIVVTLLSESDLNLCPSLVLGSMVLLRLLCFS